MATTVFDVWVVLVLDNVPDLVNMRCAWDDDITEGVVLPHTVRTLLISNKLFAGVLLLSLRFIQRFQTV